MEKKCIFSRFVGSFCFVSGANEDLNIWLLPPELKYFIFLLLSFHLGQ